MNIIKKILLSITLLFFIWMLLSFENVATVPKTQYSFYHWKSTYNVQDSEKNPPKYVKVLDITFDGTLVFRKTLFKTKPTQSIVPVVYLDNPLWSKMRATTMVSKVLLALKEMPINYEEIQVDCDWTERTKERYFKFLKLLKVKSGERVSSTIRLHQVKYYRKTGVPPVDYGVLMYYNMSDFRDLETKNYILDLEVAKRYHYNFETYPLALNLALPLYSQATIIRFEEVIGIMEGVRKSSLNENFKRVKENKYTIVKTHYFRGRLLYAGDIVRVDEVSQELLYESISKLKKVMKQPKELIFYRWGNRSFYGDVFLSTLCEYW